MDLSITKDNEVSVTVEYTCPSQSTINLMLSSDWHYDSSCCDLDLLTKHLKIAEEKQAVVLMAGDTLDAMQGRHDPRRKIEELKKQYAVSGYYDAIVADCANFLAKFDVPGYIICDGNHELAVLKNSGTDLLNNLAYHLRHEYKKSAVHMGFWGYMPITFRYSKGRANTSKLLYWFHGTSSHAVVTKGMIQVNRNSTWLKAPDYFVFGHTHDGWADPEPIEDFNMKSKRPFRDGMLFFRTPGYKNSPTDEHKPSSWASQKQRAPKNKGCYFLELNYSHSGGDIIEHNYTSMVI